MKCTSFTNSNESVADMTSLTLVGHQASYESKSSLDAKFSIVLSLALPFFVYSHFKLPTLSYRPFNVYYSEKMTNNKINNKSDV